MCRFELHVMFSIIVELIIYESTAKNHFGLAVSISGFSWFLSANQPDMMNIMITYNPILLGIFTASWTAGMAAMMFPAIVPMVLLYN